MPESYERDIEKMSNDDLINQLIADEIETDCIDPFKLQFVIDRNIYLDYVKRRKEIYEARKITVDSNQTTVEALSNFFGLDPCRLTNLQQTKMLCR